MLFRKNKAPGRTEFQKKCKKCSGFSEIKTPAKSRRFLFGDGTFYYSSDFTRGWRDMATVPVRTMFLTP